jgi:hypothetical protein
MNIKFELYNHIYKASKKPENFEELLLHAQNQFKQKLPKNFVFKYKDSDEDLITIES